MNSVSFKPHRDISLYIHIPFCTEKCDYCDFFSLEQVDPETQGSIVSAVLDQVSWYCSQLTCPEIRTIYIGGGTPSLLALETVEKLLSGISSHIGSTISPPEFTIEGNPESISRDFLHLCMEYGVNRLSLGVQSFHADTLRTLGRKVEVPVIYHTLDMIRSEWKGALSIDLITSVPGQTIESARADIEKCDCYGPDHVSLYTLTISDQSVLSTRLTIGADEEDYLCGVWEESCSYIETLGYSRYEISNFAKNGMESRHNNRYWRMKPYLGCGPGAVSTLGGKNGPLRIENTCDTDKYLAGNKHLRGSTVYPISKADFLFEFFIMGLRRVKGIRKSDIREVFHLDPDILLSRQFEKLMKENLLNTEDDKIVLTQRGFAFLNPVLLTLLDGIETAVPDSLSWPKT